MELIRHPAPVPLEAVKRLVLDAVSSPSTRSMYAKALDDFFAWRAEQGNPPFHRAAVQAHRTVLESKGYAPSTINQRLAAVKKLAREAAANGWLEAETAAAIDQVAGIKQQGVRAGNWLTARAGRGPHQLPERFHVKGQARSRPAGPAGRLRAAPRRSRRAEAGGYPTARGPLGDRGSPRQTRAHPDHSGAGVGQAGRRPLARSCRITAGRLLRSLNRHGRITGSSLSPQAVLAAVRFYGSQLGWKIQPHDLRRTCAKLCRSAGGELEQIQLLLGHASITTTERYLGSRQDLAHAPNDRITLQWKEE